MTPNDLQLRVEQHYQANDVPLLLSEFGKDVRQAGLWPVDGESRSLAEFIKELVPGLSLVMDPDAKAFVVVVPRGRESLATTVIECRRKRRFLNLLPRPIVLAFCVKTAPEMNVYLRPESPYRYLVEKSPDDPAFVLIEPEFRSPGLFLDDSRNLEPGEVDRLVEGIQNWAKKHNISLDLLLKSADKTRNTASATPEPQSKPTSALDRLYGVQPPDLREKLVIPIDIALILSRLP